MKPLGKYAVLHSYILFLSIFFSDQELFLHGEEFFGDNCVSDILFMLIAAWGRFFLQRF